MGDKNSRAESVGRYMVSIVVCLVFALAVCVVARGASPEDLLAADSPQAFFTTSEHLFRRSTTKTLLTYLGHESDAVALGAAWELMRRSRINQDRGETYTDVPRDINWFLGYVQGRLRIVCPQLWRSGLKHMDFDLRRKAFFVRYAFPGSIGYYRDADAGLHVHAGMRATKTRDAVIVSVDSKRCTIPADLIRRLDDPIVFVAALPGERTWFVALHSFFGYPYVVCCIDAKADRVRWCSRVWAAGGVIDYQGIGFHFVNLKVREGRLYTFGVADDCIYIECFDAENGRNIFRFNSLPYYAIGQETQ